ncbi:MAG TPA: flagellar motor switch protein FliN [Lacipirellulaceae bacterium]|nr:flagellar motor switch protein FliN [Lacipirellulaceae bacterium]
MADAPQSIGQDEIEQLLRQSQGSAAPAPAARAASPPPQRGPATAAAGVSQEDIELLLRKAEQALASIDEPADDLPPGVQTFRFADFGGAAANTEAATLELMRDVELDLTIELGRTHMHLEDVLKLKQGAVVPLDKLAGDPADIYVNGRLIARGEVLVLNDNFCVRVAELIVGESACA